MHGQQNIKKLLNSVAAKAEVLQQKIIRTYCIVL